MYNAIVTISRYILDSRTKKWQYFGMFERLLHFQINTGIGNTGLLYLGIKITVKFWYFFWPRLVLYTQLASFKLRYPKR